MRYEIPPCLHCGVSPLWGFSSAWPCSCRDRGSQRLIGSLLVFCWFPLLKWVWWLCILDFLRFKWPGIAGSRWHGCCVIQTRPQGLSVFPGSMTLFKATTRLAVSWHHRARPCTQYAQQGFVRLGLALLLAVT